MKDEPLVAGDTPAKKKPGRPKGSKNQRCPAVDVTPSRCPKCGSTRRSAYSGSPRIVTHAGVHEGKPFTHVVFRRTRCLDCGQCRVDREWVNERECVT